MFKSWAAARGPSLDPGTGGWPWRWRTIRWTTAIRGDDPRGRMGGGTVQLGPRLLATSGGRGRRWGLGKGEPKFVMEGGRLRRSGCWCGSRMRAAAQLADDQAPRRGRRGRRGRGAGGGGSLHRSGAWREIAAGRRRAKPFMTASATRPPVGAEAGGEARRPPRCPGSWSRSCKSLDRRRGARLGTRDQVRRLPHAVAGGGRQATLLTRKGLDWSDKFGAIVRAGAKFPDVSSTARWWRWTIPGA